MKRREFILALGATAWPLVARAQQGRVPKIGFLGASTPSTWGSWVAAFSQRLPELGWTEGRTVQVEYRWAEGRAERYAEIAAEFVQLNADVIVTSGSAVPAVRQATSRIPIVFAVANDPLGTGLVASLARPGGNITGLSIQAPELAGKRLAFVREGVSGLRDLAIMANGGYAASLQEMAEMEATARTLGLNAIRLDIRRREDIAPAVETAKARAGAMYVCADSLVIANLNGIVSAAVAARLPTMHYTKEFVAAGGLMSYGPNYPDLFRRAAEYVDRILRGTKPADLPVEQPTKFDLVINLKTAKALGLEIPTSLLALANEVIE